MTTRMGAGLRGLAPARWLLPAASAVTVTAAMATAAGLLAPAAAASAAGRQTSAGAAPSSAAADVTLSGEVRGSSGSHWPVYARVSRAGAPGAAYTDPATGRYTLPLPPHGSYTIKISPITAGYRRVTTRVTVGAAGLTRNIGDPVDTAACTAPGYRFVNNLSEDFTAKTAPPGWTVATAGNPQNTWQFGKPGGWSNQTGGTGDYAAAYENATVYRADTELIAPVLNLSRNPDPELQFDNFTQNGVGKEKEAVEFSVDGGKTWATAWSGTAAPTGHRFVRLPQAAGQAAVRVRFHYTDHADSTGEPWFWQVDDVTVGQCRAMPGGLAVGRVTDANTGRAVNGATVTSGTRGQSAVTAATPGNPVAGGGLYWLFSSPAGKHAFAVTALGYPAARYPVTIRGGQVVKASFALDAGRLALPGGPVTATARIGGHAAATVTVRNTGTASASVAIFQTWPSGFTPLGPAAAGPGAPLKRVAGHFDPHLARPGHAEGPASARRTAAAAAASGGPWQPVARYPAKIQDTAAATDPATGKVYAVGGEEQPPGQDGIAVSAAHVLDPRTGQWSALPPMSHARASAQAVFLGGRLYVTGGYDSQSGPVPYTEVYDPALGRWSAAASIPVAYYGAAAAGLDGKMYVVGGCDPAIGECGKNDVQVYDPATNAWHAAAPYPVPEGWQSCGAIAGKLYCAGGVSDYTGSASAGYVYDPGSNAWSAIPHLPIDLWGSAYAAADGELLVSGGVTAESTQATNQGYAFSPAAGGWTSLPNAPGDPVFRGASACGFYRIGGIDGDTDGAVVATATQLPGYGGCGGPSWVSARPARLTVAPGRSATVTVELNAASPSVTQPGTYAATLQFTSDNPYVAPTLPVKLTATPPASWGRLAGTVTGRSCAGTRTPLPAATVQVNGAHGTWTLTTGQDGGYELWLDKDNSPASLIASQSGWQPQAATAPVRPQATTTRNFTLVPAAGCG